MMNPRRTPLAWRVRGWRATTWQSGSPAWTLTPDMGAARIDALSVTPQGDSLDGQISLIPNLGPAIRARDEVIVEFYDPVSAAWEAKYAGVIMTTSDPGSSDMQAYRLAGIRQRLFETITPLTWIDGADVAAMVHAALSDAASRPTGMTWSGAPTLGFELGPRAPGFETIGDMLDALVATVGAFAVPSGDTYAYDGRTYAAGDIVPPCTWGVLPTGQIFFRRAPAQPPLIFDPSDARTTVTWAQATAEGDTGDPILIYVTGLNTTDVDKARSYAVTTGSVVHASDGPDYPLRPVARVRGRVIVEGNLPAHGSRITLTGPVDYMRPNAAITVGNAGSAINASNALDGNPATYAEYSGDIALPAFYYELGPTALDGAAKITYSNEATGNMPFTVEIIYSSASTPGASAGVQYQLRPTRDLSGQRTVWLPAPMHAAYDGAKGNTKVQIWIGAQRQIDVAGVIRLYAVEWWQPDGDLLGDKSVSARFADAQVRQTVDATRIDTHRIGALGRDALILDPFGGPDRVAYCERIMFTVTPEQGMLTSYYTGQAWPAAVEEQRIMLDRLARRAVGDGGRRR